LNPYVYRTNKPGATEETAPETEEASGTPEEDSPMPESEIRIYEVAGVRHYEETLLGMMAPNYLYKFKKQELIDCCQTDEPIYKDTIEDGILEIVPEPDNPHDPNAIKVLINEKLVGYIAAKDCEHLLDVIENDKVVSTACKIYGGKYKIVNEDYDVAKDRSTYSMEYGEDPYGITLYIRERP